MYTTLLILLLAPRPAPPVDYDNLPARQQFGQAAARGRAWVEVQRERHAIVLAAARGRAFAQAARARAFALQARERGWIAEDLT